MVSYDVSPDGKQVAYASVGSDGMSQLWLAPIDRSSPARQIGHSGETTPYFGPQGQILFRFAEGNVNYLEQMNQDGSGRSKVLPYPIIEVQGISPGRRWLMAIAPYPEGTCRAHGRCDSARRRTSAPHMRYCLPVPLVVERIKFLLFQSKHRRPTRPGEAWLFPVGSGEDLPEFLHQGSSRWQMRR